MFTETLAQKLDDFSIDVIEETETKLTTETLTVDVTSEDGYDKVDVTIQHGEGEEFKATLRVETGDLDSEEALAQVIVDQVNYWSEA